MPTLLNVQKALFTRLLDKSDKNRELAVLIIKQYTSAMINIADSSHRATTRAFRCSTSSPF